FVVGSQFFVAQLTHLVDRGETIKNQLTQLQAVTTAGPVRRRSTRCAATPLFANPTLSIDFRHQGATADILAFKRRLEILEASTKFRIGHDCPLNTVLEAQ